jgi:hypothetical protein
MPQKVRTGQTAREGWLLGVRAECSRGAGERRTDPEGRARRADAGIEHGTGTLPGSARTPIVLRVWWSGGQAVTRSSRVPGSGPATVCGSAGWNGLRRDGGSWGNRQTRGAEQTSARKSEPGLVHRLKAGSWRRSRGAWAGVADLTASMRRGPRRSRGCMNLTTQSNAPITQSNISEFVRT